MAKKKLLILGSGGHFNSIIDIIIDSKRFKIFGIVENNKKKLNKFVCGIKVIATDKDLSKLYKSGVRCLIIGFGFIKDYSSRFKKIEHLKKIKFEFPNIFSKNSLISPNFNCGVGNVVMHDVVVNRNVEIGSFNIINNKALIEHDVKIGSNVHVSTGVIINGNCIIGNNVFIGSGSIICNNTYIKSNTFIKAGSVIS